MKNRKIETLLNLVKKNDNLINKILVVGCGSGIEAGLLAKYFDAETIGIDIGPEDQFDLAESYPAKLQIM
ncbi:MAG: class I SAM-dependent methyltransferase, partial [Desulfamplus sp.]|nr:class I SAM-dependent methyltransferase [Desulfamplus sp.]